MDFVTITPKASKQVKYLISELPSDIGLRLAVKGGGCSGLSYDLDFTSGEENDTVFDYCNKHILRAIYLATRSLRLKSHRLQFHRYVSGQPELPQGRKFFHPQSCQCERRSE